ncbi:MAG TPA: hypothetical protein VEQ85_04455 [Lacipirellulaceae bacterium]|nr:hypothetical protein [Lacipirellulaceae bacterium]
MSLLVAAAGVAAALALAGERAAADDRTTMIVAPTADLAAPVEEPSTVESPSEGDADPFAASLANFAQIAGEEIDPQPAGPVTDARRFRPITQVTLSAVLPVGALPGDAEPGDADLTEATQPEFSDARLWGGWGQTAVDWAPTGLCHRPLYFEEVNLERYGYTVSPVLQPLISGAHFFATIPTLPYKMVVQPPRECVYTLGYYRAGSRAPRRWHHMDLVWDPTAATVEGLVVTGLVFLIP